MSAVEGQLSGTCQHCGSTVRQRHQGTVWTHDEPGTGLRCPGSGALSTEAAERAGLAAP